MRYAIFVWDGSERLVDAEKLDADVRLLNQGGHCDLFVCPACLDRARFVHGGTTLEWSVYGRTVKQRRRDHFAHYDQSNSNPCPLRVEKGEHHHGHFYYWFHALSREEMRDWLWSCIKQEIDNILLKTVHKTLIPFELSVLFDAEGQPMDLSPIYSRWNDPAGLDQQGRPVLISKWATRYRHPLQIVQHGADTWLNSHGLYNWRSIYPHNKDLVTVLGKQVKGRQDWQRQINIALMLHRFIALPHNQELRERLIRSAFSFSLNIEQPQEVERIANTLPQRWEFHCSYRFTPGVLRRLTQAITQLLLLSVDWYAQYLKKSRENKQDQASPALSRQSILR